MMLKRYSIQWRSSFEGWKYFDRTFWTRRGAAKKALKMVMHPRSLCTVRVMKNVKGSGTESILLHRTANKPYCNCKVGRNGKRTRQTFPK